jgi:hypothetical protein
MPGRMVTISCSRHLSARLPWYVRLISCLGSPRLSPRILPSVVQGLRGPGTYPGRRRLSRGHSLVGIETQLLILVSCHPITPLVFHRRIGNPAPLGLLSFASTTSVFVSLTGSIPPSMYLFLPDRPHHLFPQLRPLVLQRRHPQHRYPQCHCRHGHRLRRYRPGTFRVLVELLTIF